jgi:VanZ family protein
MNQASVVEAPEVLGVHKRASSYGIILAGVTAIIVYGSLYPFDFTPGHRSAGALQALLSTWRSLYGWGDVLVNIMLYAPFGFFLVRALPRGTGLTRIVLAGLAGLTLCTSIELVQYYDRGRDTSMSDVYANTAGALAGAAAGVLTIHYSRRNARLERHPFSALLLLCWLGNRLYPQMAAASLRSTALSVEDFYRNIANWLAVAVLLEAIFGVAASRRALPWMVAVTLAMRVFVVERVFSPNELAGGIVAVLVWVLLLSRVRIRAAVVAALFTVSLVAQALEPFTFNAVARSFGWIPFRGFLESSFENGVPVFFEKSFTYGGFVWLGIRAGLPPGVMAAWGGVMVLGLRLVQVYLPGRSAEITDAIMLLLLAAGLKLMGEDPAGSA